MRRRWAPCALFYSALAVTSAGRALAEDTGASNSTDGAPLAERAYDRSIAAYAAGDKATALAEMKESHRISPHPELLYNIAKLERELGHCEDSLAAYRSYLKQSHEGEYHAMAVNGEHELTLTCGAPRPSPQPPGYWTTPRIFGWSALAAGAVASGLAVYFVTAADSADADVKGLVQQRVQENKVWTGSHGLALVSIH